MSLLWVGAQTVGTPGHDDDVTTAADPGTVYLRDVRPGAAHHHIANLNVRDAELRAKIALCDTTLSPEAAHLAYVVFCESRGVDPNPVSMTATSDGIRLVGRSGAVVEVVGADAGRIVAGVTHVACRPIPQGQSQRDAMSAHGAMHFDSVAHVVPGEDPVALMVSGSGPQMAALAAVDESLEPQDRRRRRFVQFEHLEPPTDSNNPGTIYLLHLDRPFKHAMHYLGWASNLESRLWHHQHGTGANLLRHVRDAGIGWTLARTWTGDRHRERQLKIQGGHSRKCPLCLAAAKTPADLPPDEATVAE